jgi:hypothetical protein
MHFIRQGREYAIEQRLGNGSLKIRDVASDVCDAKSADDLIDELFEGKLELVGEENFRTNLKDKLSKSRITDISQLSDDDPRKLEIVRRLHYVREVTKAQPAARTKEKLVPIIQEVSRKLGDPNQPS